MGALVSEDMVADYHNLEKVIAFVSFGQEGEVMLFVEIPSAGSKAGINCKESRMCTYYPDFPYETLPTLY